MHLAFTYIGLKMHCFGATACYFCNFPNVNHTVVFSKWHIALYLAGTHLYKYWYWLMIRKWSNHKSSNATIKLEKLKDSYLDKTPIKQDCLVGDDPDSGCDVDSNKIHFYVKFWQETSCWMGSKSKNADFSPRNTKVGENAKRRTFRLARSPSIAFPLVTRASRDFYGCFFVQTTTTAAVAASNTYLAAHSALSKSISEV